MVHLLRCPPPRRKGTAGPVGFSPSSLAASGQCASNPSIHTRHGTTAPAKQKRSECTATNIQTDTPGEAIGPVPAPHRTAPDDRDAGARNVAARGGGDLSTTLASARPPPGLLSIGPPFPWACRRRASCCPRRAQMDSGGWLAIARAPALLHLLVHDTSLSVT